MAYPGVFRAVHWGPILALSIIAYISTCAIMCVLQWWPPFESMYAFAHFAIFTFWMAATLYNFFNAMYNGPGLVPDGWRPKNPEDCQYLQYCKLCESYKAPRSHHCRKCDRCVMKMDHHCPWINNCVGHFNHASFTYFLIFAPCGCIQAMSYYLHYGEGTEPIIQMTVELFILCMFAVGLSIGVVLAVGGLGVVQAEWRDLAPDEEEFVYPYHLGRWKNLSMVFRPKREYNGIYWPVREGCNQYTLTTEQIKQKKDKVDKSVVFVSTRKFSGAMCPVTWSPRVSCCPPCTDEPRIPLTPGDRILVSRWKKHWLYGDKILTKKQLEDLGVRRVRGWFPRKAVKEEPAPADVTDSPAHGDARNGDVSSEVRRRDVPAT